MPPDTPSSAPSNSQNPQLRGCLRVSFFYDIAEAFDLRSLRELLGPRAGQTKQDFPRRTPEYIRFEQPPVVEQGGPTSLSATETAAYSIKYYSFGALVVEFEISFDCTGWPALLVRAARWFDAQDAEPAARALAQKHLSQIGQSVTRAGGAWLQENYLVVELQDAQSAGRQLGAQQLLANYQREIAQLVRGEVNRLADRVAEEMAQNSLSYYETDLVVIGHSAALVYDAPEDAASTNQVLEYSKMQLLEFRYYDGLMTRVLSEFYDALEQKRNILLSRWSLPREAARFNTIRLDVMELTERIDNAVKFVSDGYYARIYRLAATRMGVSDYRALVDDKLKTVGELHDYMVDQFNEARTFVLEVGIAILALLDVILLFRGR